jgi:hypothetical protein
VSRTNEVSVDRRNREPKRADFQRVSE